MKKSIYLLFFAFLLPAFGGVLAGGSGAANCTNPGDGCSGFVGSEVVEKLLGGSPNHPGGKSKRASSNLFNLKNPLPAKPPAPGNLAENSAMTSPIVIDLTEVGNLIAPGLTMQFFASPTNAPIVMDIGIADTLAQTWTLPANLLTTHPLDHYVDFIAPASVTPVEAQEPGLRTSSNPSTRTPPAKSLTFITNSPPPPTWKN